MKSISLKAYAKVNLSLDVTGKLDNGYHTLRSVMQAVNLFDEITVSDNVGSIVNKTDNKDGTNSNNTCDKDASNINNRCDNKSGNISDNKIELKLANSDDTSLMNLIPPGNDNLACKAASAMAKEFMGDSHIDISIVLSKKIPVSAGLAGGSTDAAAVILALAYLWALDVNLDKLVEIGKTIGADVPFCLISNAKNNPECGFAEDSLASSAALAEGIGEILTPIHSLSGNLIFVKSPISVSTPVVYSLYDERIELVTRRPNTEILMDAIKARPSIDTSDNNQGTNEESDTKSKDAANNMNTIKANMVNVLEPIARSEYSEVAEILDSLSDLLPDEKVFMSGSGPTVVAFFEKSDDAFSKLDEISKAFNKDVKIYSMSLL